MKPIIFCFLIFLTSCFSKKNQGQQVFIKTAALKEDLNVLQKRLEEAHPGLYWYSSKPAIDSLFDNARAAINHEMTQVEFFKALLPVIAGVKCGHTNLRMPRGEGNTEVLPFTNLLPFELFVQNEKVYIRRSFTDNKYKGGEEVLSINKVPIQQILNRLMASIPADGYNQTFKYHVLSHGVITEGYALHFGDPEIFTIETKNDKDEVQELRVNAASPQQVRAIIRDPLPIFSIYHQNDIAILSVNSFVLNTSQFRDSITAIFQTLKEKKVSKLIIDLRQNGGGTNDNVSALFSFIALSPFRHLKHAEITLSQGNGRYSKEQEQDGRYIVNDTYAGTRLQNPHDVLAFKGDVVVLTSGNTTSAASEFAAIFHYQRRGKIVGEETGGCYYGSTGGNYLNLRLPNSGLEVRVPTVRIFTAVEEDFIQQPKGRGTFPDYPILPTISDILNDKDVQMEKAMSILQ